MPHLEVHEAMTEEVGLTAKASDHLLRAVVQNEVAVT